MDEANSLDAVCGELLDSALRIAEADRGNVQLFDPAVGGLRIAAHQGFDKSFLDHFALVTDDGSACGRAAKHLAQVMIEDVELDPLFAPHREIARVAGFRAVQSTPLVDSSSRIVGMVSTHYADPHRLAPRALDRLMGCGVSFGPIISRFADRAAAGAFDVLVVDDNDAVRTSFAMVLRSAGFQVIEAEDGFSALEMLRTTRVASMVLDIAMPVLDGLALLDRLDEPPPVVLVTAGVYGSEVIGRREKIFGFMQKPVAPETLINLVGDAIRSGNQLTIR